jgi:hypothetical protein
MDIRRSGFYPLQFERRSYFRKGMYSKTAAGIEKKKYIP